MKTDTQTIIEKMIDKKQEVLNVCDKEIEKLTHPEIYGTCLCRCNSIVINKERIMTITTDENHMTTNEYAPRYPTYFTPEAARRIVNKDIYKDSKGNRITLEIIGKLEYYKLLKTEAEESINTLKRILETN